jgi:hypothetical protein
LESSISIGIDLSEKHFNKGSITYKTPNYTNKQRIINSVLDLVETIISESEEEGIEPTPQNIKIQYEKRKELKQIRTEVEIPKMKDNHSFWKVWGRVLEKEYLLRI